MMLCNLFPPVIMNAFGYPTTTTTTARIRRDLFAKIATMDIAFFDSSKTGELMNR